MSATLIKGYQMNLEQVISNIAERPEMYLGEATLTRFDAFLLGWLFESPDPSATSIMQGFQRWIADRYRLNTTHSWANIVRFYSTNDVAALQEALSLFKEYFDQNRHEVSPSR